MSSSIFAGEDMPSTMSKGIEMNWPFDQEKNVAAITTSQVIHNGYPILSVVHYSDDHSWGFLCGTTNKSEDLKVISMEQAIEIDPSLVEIADLPPGWSAVRTSVGSTWLREKDSEI
ncbi:MAG: hypothetical protein GY694_03670 [Gammaproteobacteria bacterium]|nr:hypothetical protein [Gammaproteobacteria bacterium]